MTSTVPEFVIAANADALLAWDDRMSEVCQRTLVPDGGFTIDPFTGADVTDGYAVSAHPECERVYGRDLTPGAIMSYVIANEDLLRQPGSVLGGWRDPEDGRTYLDVSTLVHDRAAALALGRAHDQLAVYDFAAGESVRTY